MSRNCKVFSEYRGTEVTENSIFNPYIEKHVFSSSYSKTRKSVTSVPRQYYRRRKKW